MDSDIRLRNLLRRRTVVVPAALSLVLLAAQLWVMGWSKGFPTQDGPAHLHTALVWRSLLLERDSLFHRFCELADYLPPNLLTLVVVKFFAALLEPESAISLLAVFSVVLLYGALATCAEPSLQSPIHWTQL
jgi:hypothetical protein